MGPSLQRTQGLAWETESAEEPPSAFRTSTSANAAQQPSALALSRAASSGVSAGARHRPTPAPREPARCMPHGPGWGWHRPGPAPGAHWSPVRLATSSTRSGPWPGSLVLPPPGSVQSSRPPGHPLGAAPGLLFPAPVARPALVLGSAPQATSSGWPCGLGLARSVCLWLRGSLGQPHTQAQGGPALSRAIAGGGHTLGDSLPRAELLGGTEKQQERVWGAGQAPPPTALGRSVSAPLGEKLGSGPEGGPARPARL